MCGALQFALAVLLVWAAPDGTRARRFADPCTRRTWDGNLMKHQVERPEVTNLFEIKKGSAPWMVSIQTTRYKYPIHFCGGVLLDDTWVLTTAHCVIGQDVSTFLIVAGEHQLYLNEMTEQYRVIESKAIHPHYAEFSRENDVALLKLKNKLNMEGNQYIEAIDFLSHPKTYERESCLVLGWGSLTMGGSSSDILSAVHQTVQNRGLCNAAYKDLMYDSMLCACSVNNTGPCQSNWGGPLVCRNSELSGIASWSPDCGTETMPTVYSNATFFFEWIQEVRRTDSQ